jgi:hypothetical protein
MSFTILFRFLGKTQPMITKWTLTSVSSLPARTSNRRTSFEKESCMLRKYAFTLFVLSLLVMVQVVTGHAADSAAPSYPDWAAAVVPAYPHALPSSGPVTPTLYGIATSDQFSTVVAWYKSRVHGTWEESEGGNTWSVKSRGLRIQISRNFYDESGAEKPGTRVALTRYH